jgi:putative peptidoglycan lipid II flippase
VGRRHRAPSGRALAPRRSGGLTAAGPLTTERSIGRGAALATLGTALSRATGFLRLAALAYALGVTETRLADTYNLANTTPNIVYELVLGGVLSSVLLRAYVEVRTREGDEEAAVFLTRLLNVGLAVLGAMTVLGIVIAPWVFRAYTLQADPAVRAAEQGPGTFLLRLFAVQIIFYGLSTITTAVLRAQRRFAVPMFVPVLQNLVTIAALLLFAATVPVALRTTERVPAYGLLILGLGTTAGVAVLGLLPFVFLRRAGWRRVRGAGFRDPRFRRLRRLSAYTLGYVVANQIGLWVAIVLAQRVQGGYSAYQTAFVFFQLPHGLFTVSIATVLGTGMAERAVAGDLPGFAGSFTRGIRGMVFIMLPAVAGYLALAPEIVRTTLQHGMTTQASTEMISAVLRAFALGLVFFSGFHLVREAFQALGDTRTPMLINVGALVVNVVVNILLFRLFSDPVERVAGLAIGHAASYAVAFLGGLVLLKRAAGKLGGAAIAGTTIRAAVAAAGTGAVAWMVARASERALGIASPVAQVAQILGAGLAGLIVYVVLARILGLKELEWIKRLVPRRAR